MLKVDRNFVTALSRGISILEAFDEINPELGITQIAHKVGLSKTTVFRLVQTLVTLRYLVLSSENNKYRLGPRVLSLGFTVLQTMDLKTIAAPHLQALSDQCGETVNMAVMDGDELVYIERIKTRQIVNINLHIGSRLPLYNTAMGRALLSHQPEAWIRDYIKRMKKKNETVSFLGLNGDKLIKLIETVHIKHYAINNEDLVKGLRSTATPIWSAEGKICAAINIAVPSARVTVRELKAIYVPQILRTAQTISEALGFCGNRQIFEKKTV